MGDFEAHPRGTAEEVRLSRILTREIERATFHNENVLPDSVMTAYNNLYAFYNRQKGMEKQ